METVIIQIGNSDNKLTQAKWSDYIIMVRRTVGRHCGQVHFDGGSSFDSRWQNVCIIAEIQTIDMARLTDELVLIKKRYDQDSIAVTFGKTLLV